MKYLPGILPLFFLLSIAPLGAQTDYAPASAELREKIESTLIHLERSKAERDAAQRDLTESEKQLVEVESRMHTIEEQTAILDRIKKDETGAWTFLQAVMGDLGYLRGQWDFLTLSEKASVDGITRDLGQGR